MSDRLNLDKLHERHKGLTPSLGGSYTEAASVCLDRHHTSPVEFEISCENGLRTCTAEFSKPDLTTLNAWANEIDTTEAGAYGVCLAAVELEHGLVAVRRAETLTGADWYIGPSGTTAEDLETCFRLEVSGLNLGTRDAVPSRLRSKVNQAKKGKSNLPAIASVVGFGQRAIAIQRVETD
jgi:hypothetical protein